MTALFPGGGLIIMAMMGTLEVGKLIVAGWLHANWKKKDLSILMKGYLFTAIVVLMALTSVGIFGFLSKSHLEQQAPVAGVEIKIAQIQERLSQAQSARKQSDDRRAQLDAQINTVLGVSKNTKDAAAAQKLQNTQKKEREQLKKDIAQKDDEINKLNDDLVPLKLQISDVSAKLGPIKYVANLFGWSDTEKAVDLVILMIMFAFDPLAVVAILSSVHSFGEWGAKRRAKKEAKALAIKASEPQPFVETLPVTLQQSPLPVFAPEWATETMPLMTAAVPSTVVKADSGIVTKTHPVAFDTKIGFTPAPAESISIVPKKTDHDPVPAASEKPAEPVEIANAVVAPVEPTPLPVAPSALPSNLQVSFTPSPAFGTFEPLRANVGLAPVSVNDDPTFLSGYKPEKADEREHLLKLLGEHPEVLEQVIKIVEEGQTEPHSNNELSNSAQPVRWIGGPWFPERT